MPSLLPVDVKRLVAGLRYEGLRSFSSALSCQNDLPSWQVRGNFGFGDLAVFFAKHLLWILPLTASFVGKYVGKLANLWKKMANLFNLTKLSARPAKTIFCKNIGKFSLLSR